MQVRQRYRNYTLHRCVLKALRYFFSSSTLEMNWHLTPDRVRGGFEVPSCADKNALTKARASIGSLIAKFAVMLDVAILSPRFPFKSRVPPSRKRRYDTTSRRRLQVAKCDSRTDSSLHRHEAQLVGVEDRGAHGDALLHPERAFPALALVLVVERGVEDGTHHGAVLARTTGCDDHAHVL